MGPHRLDMQPYISWENLGRFERGLPCFATRSTHDTGLSGLLGCSITYLSLYLHNNGLVLPLPLHLYLSSVCGGMGLFSGFCFILTHPLTLDCHSSRRGDSCAEPNGGNKIKLQRSEYPPNKTQNWIYTQFVGKWTKITVLYTTFANSKNATQIRKTSTQM